MKILVLSDSHSSMRFMRGYIDAIKPDAVIHLGDFYDDAQCLAEQYPHIRFHMLPGNGDSYLRDVPKILTYPIGGVMLYMTHGHLHGVKSDPCRVVAAAREVNAQAALFGHTHQALCYREPDGLWVMNPGSCRSGEGSAGVIETAEGKITACYLVQQADVDQL